jgi:hypothetical protein
MTDSRSERLALPFLYAGQAQKEITHNEALALLDIATQAGVVAAGADVPPDLPAPGACWLVGEAPQGDWAEHAGTIAGWTAGGWRFVAAREGMQVWDAATQRWLVRVGNAWEAGVLRGARVLIDGAQVVGARRPAIASAVGGSTVDVQARAVLETVLGALRGHGLIAP